MVKRLMFLCCFHFVPFLSRNFKLLNAKQYQVTVYFVFDVRVLESLETFQSLTENAWRRQIMNFLAFLGVISGPF